MDVIHDGTGFPVGIENQRLVVPLLGEKRLDWSGNGEWLVYHDLVPDGADGSQSDLSGSKNRFLSVYDLGQGDCVG